MNETQGAPITLTREQLYERVWTTPGSRLASELGLSDVGLAKVCRKHQVPRPPRGYWARLEHGKPVRRAPLPVSEEQGPSPIVLGPRPPKAACAPSPAPVPAIVVPERLSHPHPLVKATAAELAKQKPDGSGLVTTSARKDCLDVSVSPPSVSRAMRILDTLIKATDERGWPVSVQKRRGWDAATFLVIEKTDAPLRLREVVRREERSPTPQERELARRHPQFYGGPWHRQVPTGHLELTIGLGYCSGIRRAWRDGKRQRVENLLPKILETLARYAVQARETRLRAEELRRRLAEEERVRVEREAREREDRARVDQLLAEAAAWQRAEQIREYVEDVQRRVCAAHGEKVTPRFHEWVNWALRQADKFDPLIKDEAPT